MLKKIFYLMILVFMASPLKASSKTRLYEAVNSGNLEKVKFALKEVDNIDIGLDIYNRSSLSLASEKGYLHIVKYLLSQKANINHYANGKVTPLNFAVISGQYDVVTFLVENGASFDVYPKSNGNILYQALKYKHTKIAEYFIKKSVNVNSQNSLAITSLMLAVHYHSREIVEMLINKGAFINQISYRSHTALWNAVYKRKLEIAKILIQKGAFLDIADSYYNDTALHVALKNGDLNIASLLIKKGANLFIRNKEGHTPLDIAEKKSYTKIIQQIKKKYNEKQKLELERDLLISAIEKNDYNQVLKIVKTGIDLNFTKLTKTGSVEFSYLTVKSPLICASAYADLKMIKLLIKYKARINYHGQYLYTSFMAACETDKFENLKYLIKLGANIKQKNMYGESILFQLIKLGNDRIVKILIESGLDINEINTQDYSLLYHASSYGRFNLVRYLIKRGVNLDTKKNPLAYIISDYNYHRFLKEKKNNQRELASSIQEWIRLIKLLIDKGVNINDSEKGYFDSPYYAAIKSGQNEIIQLLIDNGLLLDKMYSGKTMLMLVSMKGDIDVVKEIIKYKVNVNLQDEKGYSALMLAAKKGHYDVVKYLLNSGAQVNMRDKYMSTALMKACTNNNYMLVKLLLDRGAVHDAKDINGYTALDYASEINNKTIVKFLKNQGAK